MVTASDTEPKMFLSAPAPQIRISAPASFIHTLKITFFDLSNRIKIVTIYRNFVCNHGFFLSSLW
jgi:hypothetical protein